MQVKNSYFIKLNGVASGRQGDIAAGHTVLVITKSIPVQLARTETKIELNFHREKRFLQRGFSLSEGSKKRPQGTSCSNARTELVSNRNAGLQII